MSVRGISLAQSYGGMKVLTRETGFTILETLMVVALIGVIATIAIPQFSNSIAYFRLSGDARSVSNSVALAKMRAASNFSKTRLYVSTATNWHRVERADNSSPPHWTAEGGVTYLSTYTSFSFGSVSTPPPNTQASDCEFSPVQRQRRCGHYRHRLHHLQLARNPDSGRRGRHHLHADG